jgi:hypothetical protein
MHLENKHAKEPQAMLNAYATVMKIAKKWPNYFRRFKDKTLLLVNPSTEIQLLVLEKDRPHILSNAISSITLKFTPTSNLSTVLLYCFFFVFFSFFTNPTTHFHRGPAR